MPLENLRGQFNQRNEQIMECFPTFLSQYLPKESFKGFVHSLKSLLFHATQNSENSSISSEDVTVIKILGLFIAFELFNI